MAVVLMTVPDFYADVWSPLLKGKAAVAIDSQKSWFMVADHRTAKAWHFEQLIAVDPLFDGQATADPGNSATGAIVGGVLFGAVGAIGGARMASGRKVGRLSLRLTTNDLAQPVHEVVFMDKGARVRFDHPWVKAVLPEFDAWLGRFRVIVEHNRRQQQQQQHHHYYHGAQGNWA